MEADVLAHCCFVSSLHREPLIKMRSAESAGGIDLLGMLAAGTARLEQYASHIDSLNVFPVADGDTGNNMLLSMCAALEEARNASENSASAVAEAFSRGALVGARGNSGIILSQFWQGLARGIDGKKTIRATDLAKSMQKAAFLAVRALSKPVEGTILTVIKDIAAATRNESINGDDLVSFMERVVSTARESVARTPSQLQILREAGVVDAGGWGLQIILEGVLDYLRSDKEDLQLQHPSPPAGASTGNLTLKTISERVSYGYCTEFLLRGRDLEPEKIRTFLENRGESLVVAGNETMIRVHLHTSEPEAVVQYARSLGQVDHLNIRDMDNQHEAFLQRWLDSPPESPGEGLVSVISLVPGEGLASVFRSLGAESVVVEEQNPGKGIEDLRKAVEARPDRSVLILPNSKVLLSAVEKLCEAVPVQVSIVPAKTIPQGISAVLALIPGGDFETNCRSMTNAVDKVHSIEIFNRARSTDPEGVPHIDPPCTGLLEGELVASGEDARTVLDEMIAKLNTDEAELITIYYSDRIAGVAVEEIGSSLRRNYPCLEVETVPAGRLRSDLIVSIE